MQDARFHNLLEVANDQMGLITLADAHEVGYSSVAITKMAHRQRLERVSSGVYRVPALGGQARAAFMAAALWPRGALGILSHHSALELWEVGDIVPREIHITVPRSHRPRRRIPNGYVLHRADLPQDTIKRIDGLPLVRLDVAIEQCAELGVGGDLLEQAARHGLERGLITRRQAEHLEADLGLSRFQERA